MIYFLQDSQKHAIKIGFSTTEAEARKSGLQTGNPSELIVLLTIDGDRATEKELHKRFASHHVLGEWFQPAPELLQFILVRSKEDACLAAFGQGKKAAERDEVVSEFLDRDPPPWPLSIYLAGKISKGDWRGSVVDKIELPNVFSCPSGDGYDQVRALPGWPERKKAIEGTHTYVGPYFAGCDHGCFHGDDQHGLAAGGVYECDMNGHESRSIGVKDIVHEFCLRAIDRADVVFAWVDSIDCYGTIVEIGYAKAKGKRIWVAGPRRFRDMWFVYQTADRAQFFVPSPLLALQACLFDYQKTRPVAGAAL